MGWWATACARAGQRTFFFNAVILIFGTATCELAWPDASSDCRDTYFLSLKIESKCETQHTLPLGAGIAAPTNTTNPLENPAGFIYNFKPKVHVSYSTLSHDDGAPTRTGFLAATGNGFLGGGVSYSSYKSSQNYVGSPSAKQLGFGFANAIDPANLAAGLVFFRSVESNPAFDAIRNISRNPVNFGTLLNPKGKVKFGGTLFDLLNGVVAGGLGVATNFSEQTAFGADILGSTKKNSYIAKASLGTSFSIFQVTAGYGVTLGSAKVITWVPEGFSFGANAWLGSKVRLMIFYNQIEAFYLGATVIF